MRYTIAQVSNVELENGEIGTYYAILQATREGYRIHCWRPTEQEAEKEINRLQAEHDEWIKKLRERESRKVAVVASSIDKDFQQSLLRDGELLLGGHAIDNEYVDIRDVWNGLVDRVDALPLYILPCGGYGFEDTPKSLYRLMWLAGATVSFDDPYKKGLFLLASRCRQFFASVETWKFELVLRFYCTPEHHVSYRSPGPLQIYAGYPSSDNGDACTSELGKRWFEFIKRCAETRHMIYAGNYFEV